ncbi:MAG: cytochrome P450, partial [Alistipes sp.]|nr:cytochrome P450 [Alistipes sp.]
LSDRARCADINQIRNFMMKNFYFRRWRRPFSKTFSPRVIESTTSRPSKPGMGHVGTAMKPNSE